MARATRRHGEQDPHVDDSSAGEEPQPRGGGGAPATLCPVVRREPLFRLTEGLSGDWRG